MKINKVWVYGTLKVGGFYASAFDNKRRNVVKATAVGTMFSVNDAYPAVIFKGNTVIKGELHEYEDIEKVIEAMDRIEGFHKNGYPGNLYNRTIITVETEDGKKEKCIAYEFNMPTNSLPEVTDGVWKI